ncbi:MAG: ATP-binding protein [Calditrichaeota bacterium]|nr:MAG: ATP-binding protein [Calditrichota bacterium]
MQRTFGRNIDALENIFAFNSEFAKRNGIGKATLGFIDFVTEELFTNMVKYNPGNTNEILIQLRRDGDKVVVTLTDFDVEPFDVTQKRDVNVRQALAQRKVGGLGLHLVQQMADEIKYEYKDRTSKITLTKRLEK